MTDKTDEYLVTIVHVVRTLRRMNNYEPAADDAFLRRVLKRVVERHDTPTSLRLRSLLTLWEASDTSLTREEAMAQIWEIVGPE